MAIRLPAIMHAKKFLSQSVLRGKEAAMKSVKVPKGFLAVYVGEQQKKRFLVPVTYMNEPLFQELLRTAEEEFGFDYPMGGLTIPCTEDIFIELTAHLNRSR